MDIQGTIEERESQPLEYTVDTDGGGCHCESKGEAIQVAMEQFSTCVIWQHQEGVGSEPILLWHQNVLYKIGEDVTPVDNLKFKPLPRYED